MINRLYNKKKEEPYINYHERLAKVIRDSIIHDLAVIRKYPNSKLALTLGYDEDKAARSLFELTLHSLNDPDFYKYEIQSYINTRRFRSEI